MPVPDERRYTLMSAVLRTPEDRFANLADYPFEPNYVMIEDIDLGGLRQHYVDEGPRDGEVMLLLHGEPSWSYLYRHMIPILVEAGFRVIAPDLLGFGKSDKPTDKTVFSYARHVEWMRSFVACMGLQDITLFCQDWGGLIGLRVLAADSHKFARVLVANSGLPLGDGMSPAFMRWRRIAKFAPVMPVGKVLQRASSRDLNDAEIEAYEAPFPTRRHKAAARVFPGLVPVEKDDPGAADNRAAWEKLAGFDKPFLTIFGAQDGVTKGWEKKLQAQVPGARGEPHRVLDHAHHFIQEDAPEILAHALIDLADRHPNPAREDA
jgi:haloalkane dehalogenase